MDSFWEVTLKDEVDHAEKKSIAAPQRFMMLCGKIAT